MKRREFITLLGGASAWPLAARAQQPAKLPTIGFLGTGEPSVWTSWTRAFVERLRELGWIDGRTVAIDFRWTVGSNVLASEFAAEFVRQKVDVIVTGGSSVLAIKRATSVIPIVFALGNDPVAAGYVTNLARPGGNVTGLSLEASDLAGKRLELLREIVPGLRRLAVIGDVGNPGTVLEMNEVRAMARSLGIEVTTPEIRRAEDIALAFETIKGQVDAIYACTDGLVNTNHRRISTYALADRLPTMGNQREYTVVGGLLSYGPNVPDMFRRAADYVDKILRGAKPGDIPVEQPTKFDLIINLTTAKAIGLTVPSQIVVRADEVIE
jgi:ABC-type uncharacterized transport system substrate-binding protein